MKIKKIEINNFKRFTDLTITDIPESARLVVLVGPNGCGKTSLFEAFNYWYRFKGFGSIGDRDYYEKVNIEHSNNHWFQGKVQIEFYKPFATDNQEEVKGKFYFRTAYRNEPDFTIARLNKQDDPTKSLKSGTLMHNDVTVSGNYQRLLSATLSGVFDQANNLKTVEDLREELIGKIKGSLSNVFEDLVLSSIGDPLSNGSFYFDKGTSKDFHYKNLSAGEKSVFDLILDLIVKSTYYSDAVFCIDEPEAHMHTRLQTKVLRELYNLLPTNSQLWISTHSIGMLKQAEDLENEFPGSVVFLDFDNRDFDLPELMTPATINRTIWDRFIDLALADFSQLVAPKKIVFCEGDPKGKKNKDFDAQVYNKIFENKYHDTTFISIGSSTEIENVENNSMRIISSILKSSTIIKFIDRDDRSPQEISELLRKGIRTSKRRHIECYLFDDEIIIKLCESVHKAELIEECLKAKEDELQANIKNRKPKDDHKFASGPIYLRLKDILLLTQCGNNSIKFLRDTMAPLITEDTAVYRELEEEIFGFKDMAYRV